MLNTKNADKNRTTKDKYKTNNKMADINPTKSIITLSLTKLTTLLKRQRL